MVLSDRQKEELNRAVLDYLVSNGYPQVWSESVPAPQRTQRAVDYEIFALQITRHDHRELSLCHHTEYERPLPRWSRRQACRRRRSTRRAKAGRRQVRYFF